MTGGATKLQRGAASRPAGVLQAAQRSLQMPGSLPTAVFARALLPCCDEGGVCSEERCSQHCIAHCYGRSTKAIQQ